MTPKEQALKRLGARIYTCVTCETRLDFPFADNVRIYVSPGAPMPVCTCSTACDNAWRVLRGCPSGTERPVYVEYR